jgi:hypothetical protein
MRLLPLLAAVASISALTGCSTVLTSPLQKVTATSRPAGAEVRVDGASKGVTPATFELTRWQDHEVTIELAGYQPYRLHLSRRVNPWIAGNILNGFIFGVIVDASTGAIYKLDPPEVHADLFPRGVRRRPPADGGHGHGHGHAAAGAAQSGDRIVLSTTLQPKPHWQKIGQMAPL